MKRLLLTLVGAAFFALVGLEASHTHPQTVAPDCHVCALGAQTVRQVAAAAPSVAAVPVWTSMVQAPSITLGRLALGQASARAPPLA